MWGRREGWRDKTAPMELAEMVHRETNEHSRDSSGKGNGGQEAWGRRSKVTSEPESWILATNVEKKRTMKLLEGKKLVREGRG